MTNLSDNTTERRPVRRRVPAYFLGRSADTWDTALRRGQCRGTDDDRD